MLEWWMWVVMGLCCLVIEVLTPGSFIFIFFAIGGLAAGALSWAGLLPEFWQQSVAAGAVAIGTLLLFRGRVLHFATPKQRPPMDSWAGQIATASEAMAAGGIGKAEHRGTSWMARNVGTVALMAGQRCIIERIDGLTLWLRAE